MKLTKQQLKQIIKEELAEVVTELTCAEYAKIQRLFHGKIPNWEMGYEVLASGGMVPVECQPMVAEFVRQAASEARTHGRYAHLGNFGAREEWEELSRKLDDFANNMAAPPLAENISPEAQAALADREAEVQQGLLDQAVQKKLAELELTADELWQYSAQKGHIDDSPHFNPVKSDPAGREADVMFLLQKTVAVDARIPIEKGMLYVKQDKLHWKFEYEEESRYGQGWHTWSTSFDENAWNWNKVSHDWESKDDWE